MVLTEAMVIETIRRLACVVVGMLVMDSIRKF